MKYLDDNNTDVLVTSPSTIYAPFNSFSYRDLSTLPKGSVGVKLTEGDILVAPCLVAYTHSNAEYDEMVMAVLWSKHQHASDDSRIILFSNQYSHFGVNPDSVLSNVKSFTGSIRGKVF